MAPPVSSPRNLFVRIRPLEPFQRQDRAADLTYDREYLLRMGGVEAQLRSFGNAHTGSDTVVYFPNLTVIVVGDLFANSQQTLSPLPGWRAYMPANPQQQLK